MRAIFAVFMLGSVFLSLSRAETRPLSLMPMPASVQIKTGQLVIDPSFTVGVSGHSDPLVEHAVEIFLDNLRRQTAIPQLDMKIVDAAQAELIIHCERPGKAVQEFGEDESYALDISAAGAKLDSVTPIGIMHGLQTFL